MEGNWLYTIAEQSSPLRRGGGTIGPHENTIVVGDYGHRGGTSLTILITNYQRQVNLLCICTAWQSSKQGRIMFLLFL